MDSFLLTFSNGRFQVHAWYVESCQHMLRRFSSCQGNLWCLYMWWQTRITYRLHCSYKKTNWLRMLFMLSFNSGCITDPGKSLKIMEFIIQIFQAWNVMESGLGLGKSWKINQVVATFCQCRVYQNPDWQPGSA